jgi:hypothetical protein
MDTNRNESGDRLGKFRRNMLWTIFVALVVLWLLGFSFHVAGGFIHIALVLAVVVLLFTPLKRKRGL